ncbi:hypothetical protein [Kineococcus auxinigenes]|uniref:hypothetical protein n=1 Tax=unclassified Kineococcus TaxID=2621656 RepID=UPI003D7C8947
MASSGLRVAGVEPVSATSSSPRTRSHTSQRATARRLNPVRAVSTSHVGADVASGRAAAASTHTSAVTLR